MSQEEVRSPRSNEPHKRGAKNGTSREADAVLERMAEEAAAPTKPSSSLARALRDVILVAALLGGGTFFYYRHVTTREAVSKIAMEAADKMEKDDLASLKAAEAKYQEILALDKDNGIGLAGLAETYFHQWRHGLDTKSQAEDFLKRAIKEGSDSPERYATGYYLDIVGGRAEQVSNEILAMMKKDVYHPKLAHALGWALLEQGKFTEANRYVRAALDTDYNAVRFAYTLGEVALRQGGPNDEGDKAAIRNFSKILGNAMNPEHELTLTSLAALRMKNFGNIDKPAKWIQTVEEKKDAIGPAALAQLAWASGEFALALGDPKLALEKVEEALKARPDYPPFFDLKARALVAQGKLKDAYAAYDAALSKGPVYRGIKWDYATLKSERGDDSALAMIDELEKSDPATTVGPEYEIFRGNHHLGKDNVVEAKKAFTKAADLGDDAEILFGLAKVTFLEEKKRGNKANLDRVAEAFGTAAEARATFPELQEYMAGVSLWNYQVDGAQGSFEEAEKQFKKLNRPVPALLAFYDRVITAYEKTDEKSIRAQATKLVDEWKKRKADYLTSVTALLAQ